NLHFFLPKTYIFKLPLTCISVFKRVFIINALKKGTESMSEYPELKLLLFWEGIPHHTVP
ncbi:MAG: hypothetical protein ABF958_04295, partial [Lentilactobacillus hilgardii]|uniref:hypothetical protein n=1 Tax=Lentilactobacillus hilgardii TaxID=1588 RepID=UPI0039E9AEA1